jgi:hypothetical protein
MATKLKFKFPIPVLLQEGDGILDAAESHTAINARLAAGYVAAIRAVANSIPGLISAQKQRTAITGNLTRDQNAKLATVKDLMGRARETAKRAFPGQTVKLREQFQIGINTPGTLADVLNRARIIRASCADAANAPALAVKGWIAGDTTALASAITALDTADDTQEVSMIDRPGDTDAIYGAANTLYDGLLDIQVAASNQYPASDLANATIRGEFRLDTFPPRRNNRPPNIPPKFKAESGAAGSRQITLSWNIAERADDYTVTAKNKATGETLATLTTEETTATMTFTALAAGTEIEFTVIARNELGEGKPANPKTARVP